MRLSSFDEKGKEHPYKFESEKQRLQHIHICWSVFGAVPVDVTWTMNNPIYKAKLNHIQQIGTINK